MHQKLIFLIIYFISFSSFKLNAADLTELNEYWYVPTAIELNNHVDKNMNQALTSCPSNITKIIMAGCEASVTWTEPQTDTPLLRYVQSTHNSGDIFPIGRTTVTYVERNLGGDTTDICSFIVEVVPEESYAISNCPSDREVILNTNCDRRALWFEPDVACDLSLASNYSPGDEFPIGTTTVNYTAFKGNRIYGTCSFTVTMTDNTPPVFTVCPSNITVDANGNCEAVATWAIPEASDNCGFEPNLTTNFEPGSTFPIGTSTVTYTATDEGGNTAQCSFDVTVVDNTGPEFLNLPAEVRASADGSCGANVNWDNILVEDNCTANLDIVVNSDAVPGDRFNLGQTLVTYSATDLAGNETIASFNVIVEDNTAPINTSCPTDITVFTDSNCEAVASWEVPTFTDNCDSNPQIVASHNPGDTFLFGDTEVSYTATDEAGNETICSFMVSVEDNIAPAITSQPGNLIVSAGVSSCDAIVSWDAITAVDNCSNAVGIVSNFNSGDVFPLGETTVDITASDDSGNETLSSFTVTVEDNTAPSVVSCPNDITVSTTNNCDAVANWTVPTFSDNCDPNPVITSTHNSGDVFLLGTTLVTYTATDSSGNESTCSFNVIVEDDVNPQFTSCVPDIVLSADAQCQAVAEWTLPEVTDNCSSIITLSSDYNSGDVFPLGTTTVTYTATDEAGNSSTCSFTVSVEDNIAPAITSQPGNLIVSTEVNSCEAIVSWDAITAVDNCSNAVGIVSNFNSGDVFPLGETTVDITASDDSGNETLSSFTVTVEDNTAPSVVSCPNDITVSTTNNCDAVANWTVPTFSDNCDPNPVITSTHNSGDVFLLGTTLVTYTATDSSGNESTCSFNVIVEDDVNPQFTSCVPDIVLSADAQCQAVAEWTLPEVTDNCSTITLSSDYNSGDVFPLGTTTVTYTATDEAGNSSTCSFIVSVEDNNAPAITSQPGNLIVSAGVNSCEAIVSWDAITAVDNCSNAVGIVSNFNSGDVFPLGETTVDITASDDSGNETLSSFTVTVEDNTAPSVVSCPNDIIVSSTNNCDAIANWTVPTFSDNCDVNPVITSTHNSGDVFLLGTTLVTYTATDSSGNESTCSFNVIVEDDVNPQFTSCVPDIVLSADAQCQAVAEWTLPEVTDNCSSIITLSSDYNSGDVFPLGTTTVTYTATDEAGNSSACSFVVVVNDTTPPTIISQLDDLTVSADPDACQTTVSWNAIMAEDNCSEEVEIISNFNSGDIFQLGESRVEITARDISGNETKTTFNVTVIDNSSPKVISCPNDITVAAQSNCESIASWEIPEFSDNCDTGLNISSTHNPGDLFPLGNTLVTYTATDDAGNQRNCSFNVTVRDDKSPEITCVADIFLVANDQCLAVAEWNEPEVFDSCDESVSLQSDYSSGDNFSLGTTVVTYTAIDEAGNQNSCSFNVTVVDESSPVLVSCPSKQIVEANTNCMGTAEWELPVFEDCSALTINSNYEIGDTLPIGITEIEYTATDDQGFSTSCVFVVEVIDQAPPSITFCPGDINIVVSDNCEAVVEWDPPIISDNCSSVQMSSNFESGSAFPIGVTTVEYEFTDENGNSSFCNFDVTVLDESEITISNCPEDIKMTAQSNKGTSTVSWEEPTATSTCSAITTNVSHNSGAEFQIGTTLVTYTFSKENGQTANCSFEVTIEPLELDVQISKLLTPNGDSNKDVWLISGIEQFPDNQVIVVDRWGNEIYKASGYDNNEVVWKGENKSGELVPRGTYYYFISVRNEQEKLERKGFLEIIR